jgi:hypothetical protein
MRLGRGERNSKNARISELNDALRKSSGRRHAAGRMFWLTWNRLVGSYFFLSAARRP